MDSTRGGARISSRRCGAAWNHIIAGLSAALLPALAACGGGAADTGTTPVTPGASTAVYAEPTPEDADCPNGGWRIYTGVDENANGTLDETERDEFYDVCNGAPGETGLVLSTPEGAGANCPSGGLKIETGFDEDGDAVLEPEEIDDTSYACNGTNQQAVVDVNAPESWLNLTSVADSDDVEDNACPLAGGSQFIAFLDVDADGAIDDPGDSLIDHGYVCSAPPGLNVLMDSTLLAPGEGGCQGGGHLIETGHDDNRDDVFDKPGEVDNTYTVCNGVSGINEGVPGDPFTITAVSPRHFTSHRGTVGANGDSYYHFQTYTDGTGADYSGRWTVRLMATESWLDYEVHSTSDFDDGVPFTPPDGCAWAAFGTAMGCPTATVAEGANVYVKLSEVYSVPNQFESWITYGANDGMWGSPALFGNTAAQLSTTPRTHGASLAGWPFGNDGGSFYVIEPDATGPYSFQIDNYRTVPETPGIENPSMVLLNESANEWADWIDSCRLDDQGLAGSNQPMACVLNIPAAGGAKYILNVRNEWACSDCGGMFDITITGGDTLTQINVPVVTNSASLTTPPFSALDSGIYRNNEDERIYRVRTAANTAVTLAVREENDEWGFVSWELFDSFGGLVDGAPIQDCWDGICSTPVLTSGQDYYLRIWDWGGPLEVVVYDRHFDEGTSETPVALGTSVSERPSTVASGSPGSSWYSIGETSAVPYTVTITNSMDWNQTVMDTFYPSLMESDGVTSASYECNFVFPDEFGVQGTNRCFLDADASQTYLLQVDNYRAARAYLISVAPSPTLTLGSTPANYEILELDQLLFVFNTNSTESDYTIQVGSQPGSTWTVAPSVHWFNDQVCFGPADNQPHTCTLNTDQRYYLVVKTTAHYAHDIDVLVDPIVP